MSRKERPVSDGKNIGNGPDQFVRKHEQGVFQSTGESGKREVKTSAATLGRHITSSKSGADVAADRKDAVKSLRAKREQENFGD